jgi:phosphoribosylformimino-5-aminoimidazole carboxamide ribonucleotide (ProFAR) isomerase
MEGPPLDQLSEIADDLDAELIYSGGVGTLADLEALAATELPALGGVIVGRALYEGRFDVADALEALETP